MNIRNKKSRMSGANTFTEHLQYNEKEHNANNRFCFLRELFFNDARYSVNLFMHNVALFKSTKEKSMNRFVDISIK